MSIDTSPPRALPQGEQLRSRLTGTLWLPGDTEWDAVSASWNLTVRERPDFVDHFQRIWGVLGEQFRAAA